MSENPTAPQLQKATPFEESLALGEAAKANGGTLVMDMYKAHPNPDSPDGQWREAAPDHDALAAAIKRAPFDATRPPKITDKEGTWPYWARVTGIKPLATAVKAADAAEASWDQMDADYRAAEIALAEFEREARTTAQVACNAGKPSPLGASLIKRHRELRDTVTLYEQVMGRTTTGAIGGKPPRIGQIIVADAVADLSLHDATTLLVASEAVVAAQHALHRAGMPPGNYGDAKAVRDALWGSTPTTRTWDTSWARSNPDDRAQLVAIAYAAEHWRAEQTEKHLGTIKAGARTAAAGL